MVPPVCITGVTGYIGGHIVEVFLKNGVDVHGTVRDVNSDKVAFLRDIEAQYKGKGGGTLTLFAADLNQVGSFDEAIKGCEVVVHVAASVQMTYKKDPFVEVINPNVNGVKNVVSACQRLGVRRIVYTSSVATINCGEAARPLSDRGKPFTEDMWMRHATPTYGTYNYSKIKAEEELNSSWKGELISLLPPYVFGPQQNSRVSSSMQIVCGIANHEYKLAPPLYGDWVDVRDVARAHFWAATTAGVPNGRYNVTQCAVLSFADIGEAINAACPEVQAPTKSMPWGVLWLASWFDKRISPFMLRERCVKLSPMDNTKIQRAGFKFEYNNIVETMRDCVTSLRQFGLLKKVQ